MKVITEIRNIDFTKPTAVALGFFDGVHRGHQSVISAAVKSGFLPVVFTFAQHPRAFFGDAPELISDLNSCLECFEKLGVEAVIAMNFGDFVNLSAVEFYTFLRDKLCMRAAFYGYNYRFGKGREGNGELLARLCKKDGILAEQIAPVLFEGEPISSSRIRTALSEGNIASAAGMLGRDIILSAKVGNGKNLAHKLGFATINQPLTAPVKPLLRGVYAAEVTLSGKTYPAVTNLGARPTVFQFEEAAETHIIGFEGDLYGQIVNVRFLKYLRAQHQFENVEQLQQQVRRDIAAALEMGSLK
jgi:riboflavin kinase/FMN adenylyltransferase